MFPELYHRGISQAVLRQDVNLENARQEVGLISAATARANMVERAYREARTRDERESADRERLDLIAQKRMQE